ncbi:endo-1,3-beta-glucanase Engl1 [Microthyrium microscopicum]|uniref:glucan endo-1,3-beta-D-glucosidase n=1 Tax=Microthyrium microscopicum TaxID=703497 RepID=A0A6A6UG08_9PEZI|nr:endo-1,3-beta-glucanase Engl1 [Microthyrium microscopicum]
MKTLTLEKVVIFSALIHPSFALPNFIKGLLYLQDPATITSSIPGIQTASTDIQPSPVGINTALNTTGHITLAPVTTTAINTLQSVLPTALTTPLIPSFPSPLARLSPNILVPIATTAPPPQFQNAPKHPVPRSNIQGSGPLQTNKFYGNFYLGSQSNSLWTHPYSLAKTCTTSSCGIAVSHIERSQTAFAAGNPAPYFVNPIGIHSIVFGAAELGAGTSMTLSELDEFSANVHLAPTVGAAQVLTMPVVQGMGFVTGVYSSAQPVLMSGVFFSNLTLVSTDGGGADRVVKWRIGLLDGTSWLLYVRTDNPTNAPFLLQDSKTIIGPLGFSGTVQVAKCASTGMEQFYDSAAGAYATGGSVSASADGDVGTYTISWTKGGPASRRLLMFALPHHVESFDAATRAALTGLQMQTTTKGMATAVLAETITMVEDHMPVDVLYDAAPANGALKVASAAAQTAIVRAASIELAEDIFEQTNMNSTYWNGKALAKFAMIIYATYAKGGDHDLAAAGLKNLTTAFAYFVDNTRQYPLLYDNDWKGIISSAVFATGDTGADYGNSLYNDHHFHYGYFVYAASVLAYFDPLWLTKGTNKVWVDTLVRDYANPVTTDPYFPFSRMFDWYHGHSWAQGLYESADGKNEESTSEDVFSLYAMKLWGKTTGDENMEARGNLQLAVLRRSLQNYFLMESSNKNQPPQFIGNKACGIMFENKIDHTTYFGAKPEYVEGIHMLPLSPASPYTRSQAFVSEEWQTYFSDGRAQNTDVAWRSILYANLAIADPRASWLYFTSPSFDMASLDSGASLTWYLAFVAGLGGS